MMKEHNKMLGVWISVSCFGSTPLKLFAGLGVQASKETARKLKFSKLLSLFSHSTDIAFSFSCIISTAR